MRKNLTILFLTTIVFLGFSSLAYSAMNDYCAHPPFVSLSAAPNVLMVVDASGSMGWCAYNPTADQRNCCEDAAGCGWTYNGDEEGYFDPSKVYEYNSSQGYWEQSDEDETETCPNRESDIDTDEEYRGSCLNFLYMARVDLLRWAITGGKPRSCSGGSAEFEPEYCDPEVWDQPGNSGKIGSACNNTIGGCIIETNSGIRVRAPWSRVNEGLAFVFKDLINRPRFGVVFYSETSIRNEQVYIGDFTIPVPPDDEFPYWNLIAHLNSFDPGGYTPSGPAMWDALNYFEQDTPQYGGLDRATTFGNRWRNPQYVCDTAGANCVFIPCGKNFVILMSDGQWNRGNIPVVDTCNIDTGYEMNSADPVVPAYHMHNDFINIASSNDYGVDIHTRVSAVYSIGLFLGGGGERSLKNVAMHGSFDNTENTWPGNTTGYPLDTCDDLIDCYTPGWKGSSCTPIPASSPDWDRDGDGEPDTFYSAQTAETIKEGVMAFVTDILKRTSSGTAVSILASGEGSGSNLIQAIFYPKKTIGDTELDWVGEMQNLWYYIDPRLQYSSIREDTVPDKQLNLMSDYIVQFVFDPVYGDTNALRFTDSDGNGVAEAQVDTVGLEDVNNLWDGLSGQLQGAGQLLWYRDLGTSPRAIYTTTSGSSLISFSIPYASDLQSYLQAASVSEAEDIINYTHGIDIAGYRNRTATISAIDGTPRVWKLGDIVSSTPKGQTPLKLNDYDTAYNDSTYKEFINSDIYKDRGMVYVGGNDGMLHAFRLGKLEFSNPDVEAILTGTNLGNEEWAFIPQNALPYLKYLADQDYCHLYYVDAPPYLFDASVNIPVGCAGNYWDCDKEGNSWRTILIGGMGLGGACRNFDSTCTDCVKTPINGVGFSSYFALDVTDPQTPSLLWEFSDPAVGFSTTGPAIVRIGERGNNGRWLAVFASGPTGPIDLSSYQFLGRSDQNLKLFILDLKTGTLLRTIDTGIGNAFGGSLTNTTVDVDRKNYIGSGYYQDDAFYVGYTKEVVKGMKKGWEGGVLRVMTNEDIDPNNWTQPSTVIDNTGPVTTSIARLLDRTNHNLWLYFGTGRYFYKTVTEIDDADSQQALYGIKEPCYSASGFDTSCTSDVLINDLTNVTSIGAVPEESTTISENFEGWYINLDPSTALNKAERVITNPLAAFSGAVFFTTFSPASDACAFGGDTYLWAVRYSTGGAHSALDGQALLQVSTGSIEEINLSTAFSEMGGRRTSAFTGIPPKGVGLSVFVRPKAIKRIQQIYER